MNKTYHYLRLMLAVLIGLVGLPLMAQQDIGCEYFIGSDPGLGNGTHVSAAIDGEGNMRFAIPDDLLAEGANLIGIRTYHKNEQGCFFSPTILSYCIKQASGTISCIEYYWDEDPGYGKGIAMEYTGGDDVSINSKIPTTGIAPGHHTLGIRSMGNDGWGPTTVYDVVVKNEDQKTTRIEYFWDEDPGYGKGIAMELEASDDVTISKKVPTGNLQPGPHILGMRAHGAFGWGPTIISEVTVAKEDLISSVEYFWDEDPGYGKGTCIEVTPGTEIDMEADIATDGMAPGNHKLGVRTRGATGWSPTTWHEVIIREDADIEYAEYFWNEDPGYGKGTPITMTRGKEVSLDDIDIPTDANVHGDASLGIRLWGGAGWSPTMTYIIMVDAEGNYTLDTTAPTDFDTRNFQCLADMANDFAERGIGGEVTITVKNTDTEYAMDLTAEDDMSKVTAMAEDLENRNLWMTFTAAEGSNDVIAVTTADNNAETIGKVIRFFAHTTLENISLRINGIGYQLNELKNRREEICSDEEAAGVAFGTIADDISTAWTAQPNAETTIAGYAQQGTGNLTPGTLTNSGTRLDSLTYSIALQNANGETVYTYNYILYVHAKMAGRKFNNVSPQQGANLDPTSTTLSWREMDDCKGYVLNISSKEDNDEEGTTLTSQSFELTDHTYRLDLTEGYKYTWSVTAKGHCDEVNSGDMTFKARRLPDLTVTSITVPEHAEAGNTITVKATIANNGGGTTVKGSWNDYLYYTLDSEDFATATSAQYITHKGNLAAGENYEVSFTFKVPEQDNGELRMYVVTAQGANELEQNSDNNRRQSEAITLKPFLVNSDDLAALRKLHADFGGDSWTGTPWDTTSELIKSGNWSGVTFNTEGRVTDINLSGRALTATLSESNAPQFAVITSLNLSQNSISGDAAKIASGMPMLKTLNLSYNKIDEVSAPLPTTITSLNLTNQHRIYKSNTLPDINDMASQTLKIGGAMSITASTLSTYDHNMQNWSAHCNYNIYTRDMETQLGSINYSSTTGNYTFSNMGKGLVADQDAEVVMVASNGTANGTAYPATIHYSMGDANISGLVDVNDVQRTLNYMFNVSSSGLMNISAANTFGNEEEAGTTPEINVQDLVCTVNIVLEGNVSAMIARKAMARAYADGSNADDGNAYSASCHNCLVMDGRTLSLYAEEEMGAIDIQLSGVNSKQIRLLLDAANFSMATRDMADGVRIIIFSPTGMTLPAGTTELVKCSRTATVEGAAGSNAKAEAVTLACNQATGMDTMTDDSDISMTADGHDIVVTTAGNHGKATVTIYSETGAIMERIDMGRIESGTTRRHANIAGTQVYIVRLECEDGTTVTHKLIF